MSVQVIAVVNEKGGTAKTTTSVSLAAALGALGKKVLLVDLDGQAASSRWLGVEEDTRFADALLRGEGLEPIPEVAPGVSLAPGSGKLDSVAHDLRPTQGGQLRRLLKQQTDFDYILIDCPPSLGNRLIGNALLAASHALVPVETSILALDGLRILLTTLQDVRDGFGHEIDLLGVLACRFDARTKLSRYILAELKRALPGRVFKTVIRENVRIRECPAAGESILSYAPESSAAEDYTALAKELCGMDVQSAADGLPTPDASEVEELSTEERRAVADLRGQVNTLVRNFSRDRRGGSPFDGRVEGEDYTDEADVEGMGIVEMGGGDAESAQPPRAGKRQDWTFDVDIDMEMPEDIFSENSENVEDETSDGDAASDTAGTASDAPLSDEEDDNTPATQDHADEAETAPAGPVAASADDDNPPPAGQADEPLPWEAADAPAPPTADNGPPAPPPEPQPDEPLPWEADQPGAEAPAPQPSACDDQDASRDRTSEQLERTPPHDTEPVPEGVPAEADQTTASDGETSRDYAALRAMLDEMNPGAGAEQKEKPKKSRKRSVLKRLLFGAAK